jgi:hypothetical protein
MKWSTRKWLPWALVFAAGWVGGQWWGAATFTPDPSLRAFAKALPLIDSKSSSRSVIESKSMCPQHLTSTSSSGYAVATVTTTSLKSEDDVEANLRLIESAPHVFDNISFQFMSSRNASEKERLRNLITRVDASLRTTLAHQLLDAKDPRDRATAYAWINNDDTLRQEEKVSALLAASRKETDAQALAELVDLLPMHKENELVGGDKNRLIERLKELAASTDLKVSLKAIGKLAGESTPTAIAPIRAMLFDESTDTRANALDALSRFSSNAWSKPVRSWVEQLSTDPTQSVDIRAKALDMLDASVSCVD